MKIKKSELIESKFIVPMEKVRDFDDDMDKDLEPEDTIHVVDESNFVVPSEKVKDFDNNMGSELEGDDIIQVTDEDEPHKVNPIITKEQLVKTIKEGLRNIK